MHPQFGDILEATRDCAMVAVDMPIGLPEPGQKRACDLQARSLLARRASSIFPAPPRQVLKATRFEELKGCGLSLQSFFLFPKIRQIEERIDPQLQERIREAHPELAFQRRLGRPLEKKKTFQGREQRLALLPGFTLKSPPAGAALDDCLDAAVLAMVARDLVLGQGQCCGGERDARGLKMEICY